MITRPLALLHAQNAVRNQGYAVAVHGSWVKDLDLVAIPWQETAIDAVSCAGIIAKAIPGQLIGEPEEKAYGRLAFTIRPHDDGSIWGPWGQGFDQWYVDLSVMPRG